eukprot:Nitzschia sp. Nitz4//scaffold197_size40390//792//1646//NITZ4_007509-RA/size40390-processed-gene-0.0-mRNA-1//1//CDS//3329540460//1251//frame0
MNSTNTDSSTDLSSTTTISTSPLTQFLTAPGPMFPVSQTHPSRKRKRVHFAEAPPVVCFIRIRTSMSEEEKRDLWYPTSDLDDFKTEARNICRKLRVESTPTTQVMDEPMSHPCGIPSSPNTANGDPPSARHSPPPTLIESHTRGLEHRVCLNRQRQKHLAIRCTLKAQKRSSCPDFIASISERCTQWAKVMAHEEGVRDFCEAYCPQNISQMPPKVLVNQKCPFPLPLKTEERFKLSRRNCQKPGDSSPPTVEVVDLTSTAPNEDGCGLPGAPSLDTLRKVSL